MAAQPVSNPVKKALNALFVLAVFGLAAWLYAPGIIRDNEAAQTRLIPAYGLRLTDVSCKNVLFAVAFCSVSYRPNVATLDTGIWYMVLGPVFKDRVTLMRRPDTGEVVTDFGIKHIKRRYAALGAAGLSIVGVFLADFLWRRPARVTVGPMGRAPTGPVDGGVPSRPGGLPSHSSMPQRVPRTFGQRRA